MLRKNIHGVSLSGASSKAIEAYDAAVSGYNRFHGDPVALLDAAIGTAAGSVPMRCR